MNITCLWLFALLGLSITLKCVNASNNPRESAWRSPDYCVGAIVHGQGKPIDWFDWNNTSRANYLPQCFFSWLRLIVLMSDFYGYIFRDIDVLFLSFIHQLIHRSDLQNIATICQLPLYLWKLLAKYLKCLSRNSRKLLGSRDPSKSDASNI